MTIAIQHLNFSLQRQEILKDISIHVPRQSIYGFIGHNGAGKTTTIKLLLGLLQAPENTIHIFGKDIVKDRMGILKNTGSLVEQPSIYPHLSGYENLRNRCILLGIGKQEIERVASITKTSFYLDKKAGKYSLGMKQRLGIALALLNDPELLILDEPTNGLDPSGIHEVRSLLLDLCHQHGKTIFISSHLLSEIEKIVTHIGIIKQGKMQFEGTISELPDRTSNLVIRCNDLTRAKNVLLEKGAEATIAQETLQLPFQSNEHSASINKLLVENQLSVWSLHIQQTSLEDIFLQFQQ
ncbi:MULTISPECIES: ABC transporter ATP-binding protein [Chitinophagaceae]